MKVRTTKNDQPCTFYLLEQTICQIFIHHQGQLTKFFPKKVQLCAANPSLSNVLGGHATPFPWLVRAVTLASTS